MHRPCTHWEWFGAAISLSLAITSSTIKYSGRDIIYIPLPLRRGLNPLVSGLYLLYPRHTKYVEGYIVFFFQSVRPSVRDSVRLTVRATVHTNVNILRQSFA